MSTHHRTIVLSDIHLGSTYSKCLEVSEFLKNNTCDRLILNGDIIDGWQLQKGSHHWKKRHTRFFKVIMKMMEHHQTEVIYVRGNHDDFLDMLIPFRVFNIRIVRDYILESSGVRYLVTHGDVFDRITRNIRWLAKLGDIGYHLLLWINKKYNAYRTHRGLPYYSLSHEIKQKVKGAVAYISDFEKELTDLARKKGCQGIICGHIHQPANTYYDNIHYLNSGDWVESMSALTEDHSGKWKVVYYETPALQTIPRPIVKKINEEVPPVYSWVGAV